jgi:hypothetical protein
MRLWLAAVCWVLGLQVAVCLAGAEPSFNLQALQSGDVYGPFAFKTGTAVKLESGMFALEVIADKSFVLVAEGSGTRYGVYELVPGRMIDVGNQLFTITKIKEPELPGSASAAGIVPLQVGEKPSLFDDFAFGVQMDLLNHTKYDWDINGANGGDANMERISAELKFRKDFVTARFGLIMSSDWDKTIKGDGTNFEDASLEDGAGWFGALGMEFPIFKEGRWEGKLFGEASYSRESLSLKYGSWQIDSVVTTVTNGATNVTTTTNYDYRNHDEDATLTETMVMLGASLSYEAPVWFMYAGGKVLPWVDTSLDADIKNGSNTFSLEFDRTDPVMVYGGAGVVVKGVRCYLEVEGGGVTAVRLGLMKEL